MAFLRRKMINCEEASMLTTREVVEGINARERAHLHRHLTACKGCAGYYEQVKLIHDRIKADSRNVRVSHRLSNASKSELRRLIANKIGSV